jgi:hypothetical protein
MKWYNYLNSKSGTDFNSKSLYDNETIENENIVVCQKLKFLYFGKFENYLQFGRHMIKETKAEDRCYYEVIPGNKPQKIYFDIEFLTDDKINEPIISFEDGSLVLPTIQADESIKLLVKIISEEIPSLSYNKSHILVFSSHKENKRSYHIVVEKFALPDHKNNKLFHDKIVEKLPEQWKNIIDHSMYKSSQQFRTVGSCKFGTNRYKVLNENLTLNFLGKNGWIPQVNIESDNQKFLLLLESSLITQTHSCQILPSLKDPEEEQKLIEKKTRLLENGLIFNPLTPEEIREAMNLCYIKAGLEYGDPRFPYVYKEIVEDNDESSMLLLKRRFASFCRACNRAHEHENPFLLVIGQDRDIYLDCRRNDNKKKTYIGRLGLKPGTIRIGEEIPEPVSGQIIENFSIEPPKEEFLTPLSQKLDVNEMAKKLADISKSLALKVKIKDKANIEKIKPMTLSFKI